MTPRSYPKSARLRKRRQFQSLSKHSQNFHGKVLSISWRRTSLAFCRLGITVSAKMGHAALRNRFKRLVREAFRLSEFKNQLGIDLNVRPKTKMARCPSLVEVSQDLLNFFSSVKPGP